MAYYNPNKNENFDIASQLYKETQNISGQVLFRYCWGYEACVFECRDADACMDLIDNYKSSCVISKHRLDGAKKSKKMFDKTLKYIKSELSKLKLVRD